MSFFYDLNKKLDNIRATPSTTHGQLNERSTGGYSAKDAAAGKDIGKPGKNFEKIAKDTAERYGSKERGEKVAGAVLNKLRHPKEDVEEGMHTQHAMDLNPDMAPPAKQGILGKIGSGLKKVADVIAPGDEELLRRLEKSSSGRRPPMAKEAMSPAKQKSFAALAPPTDKITFADKIAGAKKEVDEMLGDVAANAMRGAIGGSSLDKIRDKMSQRGAGMASVKKIGADAMARTKQRGDAARGRINQMATGQSEVDESSGATTYTVAYKDSTNPKKSNSTQVKATSAAEAKAAFEEWNSDNTPGRFVYLGSRPDVDEVWEDSTNNAFDWKNRKEPESQKSASRIHKGTYGTEYDGDKDDAKAIAAKKKAAVAAGQGSRGRGRPKKNASVDTGEVMKPDWSAFGDKVKIKPHTGKVTKHKMVGEDHDADIEAAVNLLKKAGYQVEKTDDEEQVNEKAVSKKQQKFMGMVHATQKGEKAPSKEVAKVAKSMGKKDAEDFAATKHKGLPEKAPKKNKEKDVEESTTSGSVATSAAAPKASKGSGGFTFGKGIYDSLNRELEGMIAESMSINMSMNNDANGPTRSLTVTATDEDATQLAQLLKSAGLSGGSAQETCSTCGSSDCGCDAVDESYTDNTVSQNYPDYPTNTETAQDNFEYSGGLNKPKSTGQTTVPVIASQEERQYTHEGQGPSDAERLDHYHDLKAGGMDPDAAEEEAFGTTDWYSGNDDEEQDAIARMMEMAGVKKKPVEEEKTEEGNKFTGNLAKARATGKKEADLDGDGDMEKVRESIFTLTNQWKAYKG